MLGLNRLSQLLWIFYTWMLVLFSSCLQKTAAPFRQVSYLSYFRGLPKLHSAAD